MDNRNLFIHKLDLFIRKYYRNQLLRGFLLCLLFILVYLGVLLISEYLFYLSATVKKIVLVATIILLIGGVSIFILKPLLALLRIGKRISYRQAVIIISRHFPDLEDKLLNTLELTNLSQQQNTEDNSLLLASINQRINSIRPISFRQAVHFRSNFKYAKYLLLLIGLGGAIWLFYPDAIKGTTARLVRYNETFLPPADFTFYLKNKSLTVEKGEDITVEFTTTGKYIPAEVYIVFNDTKFLMKRTPNGNFSYTFRAVYSAIQFKAQSGNVSSKNYHIKILQKPSVTDMKLTIISPKYTQIPVIKEQNVSDISIPQGAVIKWKFKTEWANKLYLQFADSSKLTSSDNANDITLQKRLLKSTSYQVMLANQHFKATAFAKYNINVIPDAYPQIQVTQKQDSTILSGYYFRGIIKDDYGFSKLRFVYQQENRPPVYTNVPIKKTVTSQQFFFAFDFAKAKLIEGLNINYFFEIYDNDAINGAKKTISKQFAYRIPNDKQIYDLNTTMQDSINNKIKQSMQLSREIKKDIKRLQKNVLDGSMEKWQQQQAIKSIAEKKEQLTELMKDIAKQNQQKNSFENATGMPNEALLEKQKKIDELLQKVMNPELQKLFDELEKLANEMNNDELNRLGDQMEMSMDDFQEQMERNLQLLERYEVEMRVQQLTDRLQKLANELKKASPKNKENLQQLNQQSNKKWNQLQKDLEKLQQKNSAIKKPFKLGDIKSQINDISKQMQQSNQLMQQKKKRKASKSMHNAAQMQQQLANQLSRSIEQNLKNEMSINMDNIIRLQNNLMEFSFQEEELIFNYNNTEYNNPQYVEYVEQQGVLKDKYILLKDSLQALAARSPQVATLIGDKIIAVQYHLIDAVENANERNKYKANILQRKALTGVNDLAVFLSEALQQLMKQMANSMPGEQNCNKPNGGKPKFPSLKQEQNSLQKMLQDMLSQMKGNKNKKGMSKKMGKFLQRQEMYQQMLQKMLKESQLSQTAEKKIREAMQMLEQNILDISSYSINSAVVLRQNRILTKLLEAEKAEQERDYEDKREGKTAMKYKLSNPAEIFHNKKEKNNYNSLYNNSKVKLMNYYNKLYLDYLIKLSDE